MYLVFTFFQFQLTENHNISNTVAWQGDEFFVPEIIRVGIVLYREPSASRAEDGAIRRGGYGR